MKLMNSAMMPHSGQYMCEEISHQAFCQIVKKNASQGVLESYIGYPQNADLIKEWTGVVVPVNRETTTFKDKEQALVMKLGYRVDPQKKGVHQPEPQDFRFYLISYSSLEL